MKRLYRLLLIMFLLLSCESYAQRRAFDPIDYQETAEEQKTSEKQIFHIKLKGNRRSGDSVHTVVPFPMRKMYFTGNFFKQLSDNKLNLPTRDYKDRYFECQNCGILHYSVALELGRTCVTDFDFEVPAGIKKAIMTVTSKTGDSLGVVEIDVLPKVDFYIKVNDGALIKVDSIANLSSLFELDDDVSIVALSEGKSLNVESHYFKSFDSMGNTLIPAIPGSLLTAREKQIVINAVRGKEVYWFVNLEKDGLSWRRILMLKEGKLRLVYD